MAGDSREPDGTVTRRNLLRWGAAAASLAVVGAAGASDGLASWIRVPAGRATAGIGGTARSLPTPTPSTPSIPSVSLTPTPRPPTNTRPPGPPLSSNDASYDEAPVRSIAEYLRRTPGAPAFADNPVMLTIDDGPHPVWTPKILRLLEKYDVKATFFIIGRQAATSPELVRAAASEGHHLANHTFSHPLNLPWLRPGDMASQVIDTQDAIVRASGFTPGQFRAPGGSWSLASNRLAAEHGLLTIDWDVDPRDWSRPGAAGVIKTMLKARPGDILLCHDGGGDRSQTYTALATVLPRLKARGLQFVTLPTPQSQP